MALGICLRKQNTLFLALVIVISFLWFSQPGTKSNRILAFVQTSLQKVTDRMYERGYVMSSRERWSHIFKQYRLSKYHILSVLQQSHNKPKKCLIYKCKSYCGGFGDRIRGIISSFFLATLTHRHFIIDMPFPCPITRFLKPNLYDWRAPARRISGRERSKRVVVAIDKNVEFYSEILNTNFGDNWSQYDDIEIFTNLDFIGATFKNPLLRKQPVISEFLSLMKLSEANINSIFILLFEVLFQPTTEVSQVLDSILRESIESNASLLCVQIREGRNPTLPTDGFLDRPNLTDVIINFIESSRMLQKNRFKILVVSDSNRAVSKILAHFPGTAFTIPGPILHIDKPGSSENPCEGFLKVILDFYILGECHTSILTGSGFSGFANRRRLQPYQNLYKYDSKEKCIRLCDNILLSLTWEPSESSASFVYCRVTLNNSVIEIDRGL